MVVRLLARAAGRQRLRVLLWRDDALAKEARLCEVLREGPLRVRAATACSAASIISGFWPPQGAVAGVPAGFVIQARSLPSALRLAMSHRPLAAHRACPGLDLEPADWATTSQHAGWVACQ